ATEPSGQYYNFDVHSGDLVVPNERSLAHLNPGLDPSLVSRIVTASSAHFPSRLVNAEMNVNPRLGFAYHIWTNTVVRGGFGSYGGLLGRGAPTGGPFTPGLQNFTNLNNCIGASCTPAFTLSDPFPGGGVQAVSGLDVSGVNPYMRVPQTYQWNLTVEQRLPANFVLRTTYMGSKSSNLAYRRNINLPPASTIPLSQDRLVYPQWYSVTYSDSGGNASYQSWDTQFTRRWANGLTVDGGYSLTKCITDDDEGGLESNNGSYGRLGITIEDPYSRSRDRGNCESIARHRFRTLYVYDLPLGRGRTLLKNPQGVGAALLNAIAGGWSVSGFFIASTGRFYTPYWSGFDAANTGQTFIRPDRICSGVAS